MQKLLEDNVEKTLIDSFKNFKETEAFQNIVIEENSIFLDKLKMKGKHVLELGCGIHPCSFGL